MTTGDHLALCERRASAVFAASGAPRSTDVALYLAHVGDGIPMREIARANGRQPSTVLRAIRRVESLRDDPAVDAALAALEAGAAGKDAQTRKPNMPAQTRSLLRNNRLSATERAALEALEAEGAFLLVAMGAERAGVFGPANGFARPLVLIAAEAARRLHAEDWLTVTRSSEASRRFALSEAGRAMLRRRAAELARAAAPAAGFGEAPTPFLGQHQMAGERRVANPHTGDIETIRVNLGESPLGWLSRRKDANGVCLLSAIEVEAGERLREDFELAEIGPKVGQDWSRFLAPVDMPSGPGRTPSEGPIGARDRFAKAVAALGPGLADAAVRICCFQEGLEATERRMGWSARSGKVVLKLALQRLADHYGLARRAA